MMKTISVKLFAPRTGSAAVALLSDWPFGLDALDAEFSTILAGGFEALTLKAPVIFAGIPPGSLLEGRSDIRPFAHVEVSVEGQPAWEGLIKRYLMDGVNVVGFRAEGYGVGLNHVAFAGISGQALDVLSAAIRDTAPFLRLAGETQVVDPGFALDAAQTARLSFADLVAAVNKNGSTQGFPVRCQVWERGTVVVIPNIPPDVAQWQLPPDAGLRLSDIDLEPLVGTVTIVSDGQATTVNDPGFVGRYGIARERVIDIGSGAGPSQREAFGRAYLAAYSTIRVAGTWSTTEWVPTPSGAVQPPERVRAGDWVSVPGVGVLQIVRTRLVYPARQLTVEFGALSPEAAWYARMGEVQAGVIRRLQPTSWLPR